MSFSRKVSGFSESFSFLSFLFLDSSARAYGKHSRGKKDMNQIGQYVPKLW